MDACIWTACLLIGGFFFLSVLILGAHFLILASIGAGLLLLVIGVGAMVQGATGTGLILLGLGIAILTAMTKLLRLCGARRSVDHPPR